MILIDTQFKHYESGITFRNELLRLPLGQNMLDEDLSDEKNQVQIIALENDEIVGIVMLIPNYKPGIGKLRQMATAEHVRGKRYGISLVSKLEQYALENGMHSVLLHSRHYAVGFYKKLGYKIISDVFQEVGMDHYVMEKKLG